jgi:hypothetical protein
VGCNPLADQASGIDDPTHDFAEGLARSFVANQPVKVPQIFRKWGWSCYLLCHNRMPPEISLPSLYHLNLGGIYDRMSNCIAERSPSPLATGHQPLIPLSVSVIQSRRNPILAKIGFLSLSVFLSARQIPFSGPQGGTLQVLRP